MKLNVRFILGLSSDLNASSLGLAANWQQLLRWGDSWIQELLLRQNKSVVCSQAEIQQRVKKECESTSKCLSAETRAFMLRCHHGVRSQSKGLLEVLCSVWAYVHVCVQMCKMFSVVSRQAHVVLTLSCRLLGTLTKLLRGTAHPILLTPSLCRVNIVVFDSLCLSLLLWFCWTILNILGVLGFPFAYSTITHEDSYKNIYL